MRNFLLWILFLLISIHSHAQIVKHTTQLGLNAFPFYDAFNQFPQNQFSGFGLIGNLGYFPVSNFVLGVQYLYATASNKYVSSSFVPNTQGTTYQVEEKKINSYINIYLRYYLRIKGRFYLYPIVTSGVGIGSNAFSLKKVTNANPNTDSQSFYKLTTYNFMAGAGAQMFIHKNFAVEINFPFARVNYPLFDKYFSEGLDTFAKFNTFIPSVGLQFFIGN